MLSPTPLTSHEVTAALWESRLVPGEELRLLSTEWASAPEDGFGLAQELTRRGLLTPFQVEQLLAGNGEHLVLGGYRVLDRLGEGGMGQVYKAEHQLMQRVVALKVIAGDPFPSALRSDSSSGSIEFSASVWGGGPSASALGAFHREARAAGRLRHPNIIAFHDAGEDRGIHFLVMEYVQGIDLGRLVRESGPLPVALACEYIRQAAVGLQYAYEQGVIHRDIKPPNLLLTWEEERGRATLVAGQGVVKLLDLGLARLGTRAKQEDSASEGAECRLCGTPDFLAPEVAEDSRIVDTRSDLYSLGCTLYYLLTGHAPYPGGTWTEKILRHRLDAVTPPQKYRSDLPGAVVAILYRLLAKDPGQRYSVPADLATALTAWLASSETEPRTEGDAYGQVAVQTPDLMCEGTWPSLDMVEVESPQPPAHSVESVHVPRASVIARKAAVCVAALSLSGLLGLGLAWLVRQWEQREPGRLVTPIAAIPRLALAAELASPAPRQQFAVRGCRFSNLAEALQASCDGDIVTIEGNGPYAVGPLTLRDKSLTLQAAPGCRPSVRLTPTAAAQPRQALLTTNRALTLIGLDLVCPPPADGPKAPREPMHLVYCEGAPLCMVDCHLSAPGVTAPIVCRNTLRVEMRNCKLAAAGSGLCVEIGSGSGCELVLEYNQITMEQADGAAVALWSAEGKSTSLACLRLERNTMNCGRVLACTALAAGVEVSARGNEVAFEQALVSYAGMDASRRIWRGGDNTYHAGGEWLLVDGRSSGVRDLAGWQTYCGGDEAGSRER